MLKALIVDDEGPARKRLAKLLSPLVESGRVNLAGEARDGVEALDMLAADSYDVMFLDVQMPELSGFDVLDRVAETDRPIVIFTTAYDEYAVKAFEANAIDYLLKPIDADRLEEALARAERVTRTPGEKLVEGDRCGKLLDWLDEKEIGRADKKPASEYVKQLSVPYRDRLLIIQADQIVAAEVRDSITRLVVLEDHPGAAPRVTSYIVSYTLDQLESNLDPDAFMRVHRSAIVRVEGIREMITWFSGRFKLVLEGGHEVIASRERSKALRHRLTL